MSDEENNITQISSYELYKKLLQYRSLYSSHDKIVELIDKIDSKLDLYSMQLEYTRVINFISNYFRNI